MSAGTAFQIVTHVGDGRCCPVAWQTAREGAGTHYGLRFRGAGVCSLLGPKRDSRSSPLSAHIYIRHVSGTVFAEIIFSGKSAPLPSGTWGHYQREMPPARRSIILSLSPLYPRKRTLTAGSGMSAFNRERARRGNSRYCAKAQPVSRHYRHSGHRATHPGTRLRVRCHARTEREIIASPGRSGCVETSFDMA